ncbi:MAG: sigma-70 family RNA polymerase sigma factor [Armatimonadetes bacterium]|nr:sigma-70 family RNA polymerase sigma factor [Armatimonadota bacterium]
MTETEASGLQAAHGPLEDQALVVAIQRGDAGALDVLVRRYHAPLTQFLDRLLGDPDTAADLAQETFLKMMRALPRYQPRARFSTWLYTIAHHLALDHLRRHRSRQARTDSLDDPLRAGSEPATEARLTSDTALDRVAREDVRRALDSLSPEHRTVMLLHYFEAMSYKEIADTVGCTVGTVGSRLHYAVRHVRRELGLVDGDQAGSQHR